ncbi:hypothetical protein CIC12_11530 [Burkholderia sp. SG-MS1]|uniref:hypothetical protein n=1 Tax=Paraburkholderia sp. SG-MS1 TaxID=2023741 RepID=UPI0014484854|nr:hypothetical protein [Paraburkholderia sp. SG-MS1]NKJ47363.1 hypothetical protein [Paraburkholderia sp. SG-MS1]
MFNHVADLQKAILEKDPRDFVSHYLFEPIPFAFSSDMALWISWKTTLANGLEVDPHDIVLTGSGAIGYSLNPAKKFRKFDDRSDFDCGVISSHHFEMAWRYLRYQRPSWLSLTQDVRNAIKMHSSNYVFSGTIATDKILPLLPFGQTWQKALDKVGALNPANGRDVKLRIYKDYDSLRQYQAYGIGRLRESMLTESIATTDIEVED